MNTNLKQWYTCANTKYFNLWQAYEEHHEDLVQGKALVTYNIDTELLEALKGFPRPNTDPMYIRSLMVKQLKHLRKKYNKLRLLYTGGTDSHTILKLALENDIFIDETITYLVSFVGTPKVDIEYLNGVKFAKQHAPHSIGKVTVIQPEIDSMRYYYNEDWYMDLNVVKGCPFWLRGQYVHKFLPEADASTITLVGTEKPQVNYNNGKLSWCILDDPMSEYMDTDSIYHFFCDKNNPELLVSQLYAFIDTAKNFKQGHNFIDDFDGKTKIQCLQNIGCYLTGKDYIDKAMIGKKTFYKSMKNKMWIKELIRIGHKSLLDLIYESHEKIYQAYKDIPHGVEYENGFVKSVGRYSEKIAINPDALGK